MAGLIQKAKDAMADFIGVPRDGETQVDMHNRMTGTFIKDHTQKPGEQTRARTQAEARRKHGIAVGADYAE